jgi:hypothetical protein
MSPRCSFEYTVAQTLGAKLNGFHSHVLQETQIVCFNGIGPGGQSEGMYETLFEKFLDRLEKETLAGFG